ncbi:hypothetical protein KUCAC02_004030, partial [Chaenocephalus aceratus]
CQKPKPSKAAPPCRNSVISEGNSSIADSTLVSNDAYWYSMFLAETRKGKMVVRQPVPKGSRYIVSSLPRGTGLTDTSGSAASTLQCQKPKPSKAAPPCRNSVISEGNSSIADSTLVSNDAYWYSMFLAETRKGKMVVRQPVPKGSRYIVSSLPRGTGLTDTSGSAASTLQCQKPKPSKAAPPCRNSVISEGNSSIADSTLVSNDAYWYSMFLAETRKGKMVVRQPVPKGSRYIVSSLPRGTGLTDTSGSAASTLQCQKPKPSKAAPPCRNSVISEGNSSIADSTLVSNDAYWYSMFLAETRKGKMVVRQPVPKGSRYIVSSLPRGTGLTDTSGSAASTLQEVTAHSLFGLDRYTGQIRTLRSFTETDEAEHKLLILVKDNGNVSLSATATVVVKLVEPREAFAAADVKSASKDDEDNNVTFYLMITLGSVSTLFLISIIVLIAMQCSKSTDYTSKYLQETNYDGTLCHSIQYRSGDKRYMLVGPRMSIGSTIAPGSHANTLVLPDRRGTSTEEVTAHSLFGLDRYTGQIRTLRSFTETDEAEHKLLILVKDNGNVSLSATATVVVKLVEPREAFAAADVKSASEDDEDNNVTFYLMITLGSVSTLFLISIIVLIAMQCSKSTDYTSKYLQETNYDGTLCHSIQYRSGDKRYMLVGPRMSIGSTIVPGSHANTLVLPDRRGTSTEALPISGSPLIEVEVTAHSLFGLDRYTGQIRTLRSFTETDEAEHKLLILVKDNGNVSLSATATVVVKLVEPREAFAAADVKSASKDDEDNNVTFYLMITLGSVSTLFLISIIVLIAMQCSKSTDYTSKYLQETNYDGTLCHSIQYRSGDKRYMLVGPRMSIGSTIAPGSHANTLVLPDRRGHPQR